MRVRHTLTASALALAATSAPAVAQDSASEIVVTAQRENATEVVNGGDLGALGNKDSIDVPFVVRTFDETLIVNQQPLTLGEVLENDPSVRTFYGFGNASEQFVIRGFPLFGDDIGMNGLYGVTPRQLVSPELYSGVQVLNGASAFLNGAAPGGSGIGGNVNLQLKRATPDPVTRVTANYVSSAHFGGSVDVSRRFGNGEDMGLRVNAAYRSGDVSIDDEFRETLVASGSFDWQGENARFFLDAGYQRIEVDRLRPQVAIGTDTIPDAPDSDINYGQPFSNTELRDVFGLARFEYDVADNAMIYVTGGVLDGNEEGTYSSITVLDAETGAASGGASIIPARINNESIEAGMRIELGETITHEINFGTNVNWQEFRTAFDFRAGFDTNLYDPVIVDLPSEVTFASGDLNDPPVSNRSRQFSVFASDTIGLWDDRILVTGGVRLQQIKAGLADPYEEDAVTPVAGMVFKPLPYVSVFANRIESLAQGPAAPTSGTDPDIPGGPQLPVTNTGQILPPAKSVQYEVGAKLDVGIVNLSLAAFEIEQPSFFLGPDPDNDGALLFSDFGRQRNRGIEFFVAGEFVEGLRLIGGASVIDAELVDTPGGENEGNTALGVPDYTINANVEWDLPFVPGFTLTGRAVHTGEQFANNTNTLEIEDWTRFDVGARYVFAAANTPVTLRLTVDNVTDEDYWTSAYTAFASSGERLLQGRPRTFKASISADF
ncbi:TonB-dependent receptor [Pelagerythrobacter sp.]|uniref:TonB-dependent receptor n=1 Tax=Pelagerythrobacter sp. TaxID=2800702 RepID=UPI0035B47FC6